MKRAVAPVEYEGLSQFRPPLCYELTGKSLELALDNGLDYTLSFPDDETVTWGKKGQKQRSDHYECLKGDDTTYFINAEIKGAKPRTGLCAVLDMENSLVTVIAAYQGTNPKLPGMVTNKIVFGAIVREGQPLPFRRHGYTRDMLGTAIEWDYGTHRVVHLYSSEHYYRLTHPTDMPEEQKKRMQRMKELRVRYPQSEEPADYIKIKDGLYLFNFIEANEERCLYPDDHGNNMTFLMNLKRLTDVGRSFGINPQHKKENYTYGAVGRIVQVPEELFTEPSAYRV